MEEKQKISRRIVDLIIRDISDRSGIGDEWDQIDNECKKEIKDEWRRIIEDNMVG